MPNDDHQARGNKILFVLSNVAFAISWLSLCVRLIQHWHTIDRAVRADVEYLAFIFLFLWIYLLLEKTKGFGLMLVLASLIGVLPLAYRFI
jgi:multisubunit Na+/H+ antiporter MnhF subunit